MRKDGLTVITVDIETVVRKDGAETFFKYNEPTQKLQKVFDSIEDEVELDNAMFDWYAEKAAFVPHYIEIVGLNWMELGGQPVSAWVGDMRPNTETGEAEPITEEKLLNKFWGDLCLHDRIVGANIVNFDFAVIKARTAMHRIGGVSAKRDLSNIKPWDNDVIDITARMNPYGKYVGMKVLREVYFDVLDIPEEYHDILDETGGSVADLWAAGDIEALRRYGKLDAITGIELYKLGNGIFW